MVTLPPRDTTPIFSLISFWDHFLLLCALVLIIQKEIFSPSIQSVIKCCCRVFLWQLFFFFSFNSSFILLLFCKIKGEDVQWPRFIPNHFPGSGKSKVGLSLPSATPTAFFFFFSPCTHTSLHPFNSSATPITSDSFLCFMATPGVAPGMQEQITGFGTKEGRMTALPLSQMCFVTPASVT